MLSIKRVPTVVSNYQKDEGDSISGCGRNCLKSCCIQEAKLPLYGFKRSDKVEGDDLALLACDERRVAFLDSIILGQWEDRMQRGLFRYDVTACETKVIPGEHGFIAQLNEGRHLKKRPTEFRVDTVLQPFDETKFNFTKVGQEEILFQFEASSDGDAQFFPDAPIVVENSPSFVAINSLLGLHCDPSYREKMEANATAIFVSMRLSRSPNSLWLQFAIVDYNVSPIEYGHVLLVPRIFECLPQRIDHASFLLALHMAAEAGNPYFRLGYNSLGAFATINHLHFQAYYLKLPFPIEKAPIKKIGKLNGDVKISKLLNYPVRGLVFEGGHALDDLANSVSEACICLQDNNIPYNVLISDCGRRVFLLPQCYAEKQALGEVSAELLDTQVNPAVWEISGHMVLKRKKDFDEASEANACRLLAEVSLSEPRFEEVNSLIFQAITSEEIKAAPQCIEKADAVSSNTTRPSMVAGSFECQADAVSSSTTQPSMVAGSHECLVLQ